MRRDMHRLFERMRTLAPGQVCVSAQVSRAAELAMEFAADECGVPLKLVRRKCRKNDVAWARHVAIYCARHATGATMPEIQRSFGFLDQATIKYALNKVRNEPAPKYQAQVQAVADRLRGALIAQPPAGKRPLRQSLKKMREEKAPL